MIEISVSVTIQIGLIELGMACFGAKSFVNTVYCQFFVTVHSMVIQYS